MPAPSTRQNSSSKEYGMGVTMMLSSLHPTPCLIECASSDFVPYGRMPSKSSTATKRTGACGTDTTGSLASAGSRSFSSFLKISVRTQSGGRRTNFSQHSASASDTCCSPTLFQLASSRELLGLKQSCGSMMRKHSIAPPRAWRVASPSARKRFAQRLECLRSPIKLLKNAVQSLGACGRSSDWLERCPVTAEVAGSSPVARAIKDKKARRCLFVLSRTVLTSLIRSRNMLKTSGIRVFPMLLRF